MAIEMAVLKVEVTDDTKESLEADNMVWVMAMLMAQRLESRSVVKTVELTAGMMIV